MMLYVEIPLLFSQGVLSESFYEALLLTAPKCFPWKSVWKPKVPNKVSFFLWTAALGKKFTIDNLWI